MQAPILERIDEKKEALGRICRAHGIKRLALFGSALGADFNRQSDIDLLVEFLPGQSHGMITMASIAIEMGQVLRRKVDLRTPKQLSRYFRDEVVRGSRELYAAPE